MKIYVLLLVLILVGILSCKVNHKSTPATFTIEHQKREEVSTSLCSQIEDKYIHTTYEYKDARRRQLLIQNSYPKGGLKYTDFSGQDFTYAIFWTQITNQSDDALNVTIEFSNDLLELPSSPSIYFKLYLPTETMTTDKVPLFNYGLENLKNSLDNGLGKSSSLQKTIHVKEQYIFYVVALSNKGVDGVVRAGFSLEEQNLFFRVNEIEIRCGEIEFLPAF